MNGIILVDKPEGKTSHDIVNFVRRLTNVKRVGHTGTLDPLATGVLPICVGSATKTADMLTAKDKRYTAELILGMTTDTGDCEGEILSECKVDVCKEEIEEAVKSFLGEYEQLPPMYSAIKQNGKKLYELAREGITVERKKRLINIFSIDILDIDMENYKVKIDVHCSKGTYIRVLCEDIGIKLHCGAYMNTLRRTASGQFIIDDCNTLRELENLKENNKLDCVLIDPDCVFDYEKIVLNEKQSRRIKDGVMVSHPNIREGELYRVYSNTNEFLCIAMCVESRLKLEKSFW